MRHRRRSVEAGHAAGHMLPLLLAQAAVIWAVPAGGQGGTAAQPPADDAWQPGRATFYDSPNYFAESFIARGAGAFGNILYGSCGYFEEKDGEALTYADVPYSKDAVGAPADTNPDYPGSCGRCYEVRCRDGYVPWNNGAPTSIYQLYWLPGVNSSVKDTYGRSWPGMPETAVRDNLIWVECWNDTGPIEIVVIDTCPCQQQKGNISETQQWCCGPLMHIDLSFWAFEKLAHPLYGVMAMEFRPVACSDSRPLPFLPGFVNHTIYGDKVESGWDWRPYYSHWSLFWQPGAELGGSNATCASVAAGGGLNFGCRLCQRPGYQPFAAAKSVQFWVRGESNVSLGGPAGPGGGNTTPAGPKPNLKVFIGIDGNSSVACNNILQTGSLNAAQQRGDYYQFIVPFDSFGCSGQVTPQTATNLQFQNPNNDNAVFCIDSIDISQ